MWKNILSWAIAITISFVVLYVLFKAIATAAVITFYLFTYLMFAIIIFVVAVPLYMIVKKKLLK